MLYAELLVFILENVHVQSSMHIDAYMEHEPSIQMHDCLHLHTHKTVHIYTCSVFSSWVLK